MYKYSYWYEAYQLSTYVVLCVLKNDINSMPVHYHLSAKKCLQLVAISFPFSAYTFIIVSGKKMPLNVRAYACCLKQYHWAQKKSVVISGILLKNAIAGDKNNNMKRKYISTPFVCSRQKLLLKQEKR